MLGLTSNIITAAESPKLYNKYVKIISVLVVLIGLLAMSVPSYSAAYLYAGKRNRVNCGVLLYGGNASLMASVGDIFYFLDNFSNLKPSGWSFQNPISQLSASLASGKKQLDYWIIDLSSAKDLSKLDVLYMPVTGNVNLNFRDMEKLRKFVDDGGVLWIDSASTASDFQNTFFIRNFEFKSAGNGGPAILSNGHHPLLTIPYTLSSIEVSNLGTTNNHYCVPGYKPTDSWDSMTEQPVGFDILLPIANLDVGGNDYPTIAANTYGSGRIVATSNFVGRAIITKNFPYNLPDVKFAYNVMSLVATWNGFRKDMRHSASTIDTIGSTGLVQIWTAPFTDALVDESSPAIYKNVVFYSRGGTLYAFDLVPSEDLDQDGNPDDGALNTGNTGEDLIWSITPDTGGTLSSPSVISLQSPSDASKSIEAVMVLSDTGKVSLIDAFPNDKGVLKPITDIITDYQFSGGSNKSTPLYVNGWIYAVGSDGKMYAYSPLLKAYADKHTTEDVHYEWSAPKDAPAPSNITISPGFGYVENNTTGAVVGMLYWVAGPPSGNTSEENDFIWNIPIQVSRDRIKGFSVSVPDTKINVSYPGMIHPTAPCFVSINSEPPIEIPANIGTLIYRNGSQITVPNKIINKNDLVYASYSFDYSDTVGKQPFPAFKPIQPPCPPAGVVEKSSIIGSPVMASSNLLYFNGDRLDANDIPGSIYAVLNDGSTQKTVWNYFLQQGVEIQQPASADTVRIPSAIRVPDPDPINMKMKFPALLDMINAKPVGSPVVFGGKVYTAINGEVDVNGTIETVGAIVCFKANAEFSLKITNDGYPKSLINPDTKSPMIVKIWQPNLFVSTPDVSQTPNISDAVQITPSMNMIDYGSGIIRFNDFSLLRVKDKGRNYNTFTPSLPVWVYLDNIAIPVDFSTWRPLDYVPGDPDPNFPNKKVGYVPSDSVKGDAVDLSEWNNMLWYYPLPDLDTIKSSPIVIGKTIYTVSNNGKIYALDAETGIRDAKIILDSDSKIKTIQIPGATVDKNISPAVSNGVLIIPSSTGLHAYANTSTLVADSGRVVELDGAGDIKWSVDSIYVPVVKPTAVVAGSSVSYPNPPARRLVPINKPAKVKYTATGEILIVNSGSNQVVKIDKGGNAGFDLLSPTPYANLADDLFIKWSYDRFADPDQLLRPGQPAALRSPADAVLWQEFENDILVIHCLIADSGNHRIVDLVYRINPNTGLLLNTKIDPDNGFVLPDLNWVSKTDSLNQKNVYDCIQLVWENNTDQEIWAAVSNYATDNQTTGGAIVKIGYKTRDGNGWDYTAANSGTIISGWNYVMDNSTKVRLSNPRFFQVYDKPNGDRLVYICDNQGVHQTQVVGTDLNRLDFLSDLTYRDMIRYSYVDINNNTIKAKLEVPLNATCIQELATGNWLITNGYSGVDKSGELNFVGEVFEFNPSFIPTEEAIIWSSPSVELDPNASNKTDWKQVISNSYLFRQPRAAMREY